MEQLFIWGVLTLVPLIPVILLFYFFENFAYFVNTSKGIKMGGSIAAYFVLLGFSFSSWHFLIKEEGIDPYAELRHELAGFWYCEGTYVNRDGEIDDTSSEMQIVSNGHITIHGLTERGMSWTADEVILRSNKMTFVYNVPLSNNLGLTSVRFIRGDENQIDAFHGTWGSIGSDHKGSLICERSE